MRDAKGTLGLPDIEGLASSSSHHIRGAENLVSVQFIRLDRYLNNPSMVLKT